MAENYKELYRWAKYMLEKYQDEIVPCLREQLEKRLEVVRCKDCKHFMQYSEEFAKTAFGDGDCYIRKMSGAEDECCVCLESDFCSYGER